MARPTKREQINKKISQAMSKQTPETIQKLREAFAIDASIEEACFYAEISVATYYSWMKSNSELLESLTALRNKPVLKARQTIVSKLDQIATAQWYIERKRPDEFSTKTKVEHMGSLDDSLISEQEEAIAEKYESEIDETLKTNVTKKAHEPKGKDRAATPVHQAEKPRDGTRSSIAGGVPTAK